MNGFLSSLNIPKNLSLCLTFELWSRAEPAIEEDGENNLGRHSDYVRHGCICGFALLMRKRTAGARAGVADWALDGEYGE